MFLPVIIACIAGGICWPIFIKPVVTEVQCNTEIDSRLEILLEKSPALIIRTKMCIEVNIDDIEIDDGGRDI